MPSKKSDSKLDKKMDSISIIIGKMGPPPKRKGGISVDGKQSEEEDMEAAMAAEEAGEGEAGEEMCPHCGQPMPDDMAMPMGKGKEKENASC